MALGRTNRPGHLPLIAGLSYPLGLVGTIGGYLVLGQWGLGLHFVANLAIQLLLLAVFAFLAWFYWRMPVPLSASVSVEDRFSSMSRGGRWLFGIVLVWLVLRWLGIVVEVIHRPLFPWDAWYAYGLKAKVWFFHPQFDIFANGWRWFEAAGPAWSVGGTRHPPGIGLIQLWSLQTLGRYDDALMNLAWPMALAALGLVLFGALRMLGGSLLVALGTAAVVLTLPVLNIQTVLAGYGDLWIALLLLIALVGGVLARGFGLRWLIITGVAVAGMLMIKETSWLWTTVLALGLLAGWVRMRWLLLFALLIFLGVCGVLWLYGEPIRVSTLGRLGFDDEGFVWPVMISLDTWREVEMWPELLRHMLVYRNWHLFWYLVPVTALASLWYARSQRVFAMGAVLSWGGLALLVGFFSFSTLGNAVIDGTSVNRLLLHLVPAIGLLSGLVIVRWRGRLEPGLRS